MAAAVCLAMSLAAGALHAQDTGSIMVHGSAGVPPGTYSGGLDVYLGRGVSAVVSIQDWESKTGCLLESLKCSRGGRSFGVGAKIGRARPASWSPFVQLEVGPHRYARADVTVGFVALRAGVAWRIGSRLLLALGLKAQLVGGATYAERFGGYIQQVSAKTLTSPQVLVGVRLW